MADLIADSKSLSSVCPLLLYDESVEQRFMPDLIAHSKSLSSVCPLLLYE